jgi:hypothetical protein
MVSGLEHPFVPDRLEHRTQKVCHLALHGAEHFDMLPNARQMTPSLIASLVVILVAAATTRASEDGPIPSSLGSNAEVLDALMDVRRKYGGDAVLLEGYLLTHAIQGGSVGETVVSVPGFQERDRKKYLAFRLETGIVYNDHEISAEGRLSRTWSRIVERTLKKFRAFDFAADGLAFHVTYAHKSYRDEADLRLHLRESPGDSEAAVFYLLTSDVHELIAQRIDGQQLADRAIVLVDGSARRVRVEPEPASGAEVPDPVTELDP